jgi:lysozyme family protein
MKDNFEQCLALVLKHEGGFVNHPKDPGGMTNLGVTKKVWEDWVGHPVDEAAMRALGPEDVAPLYKKNYWDKCRCDDLARGVDFSVFDVAVNSGTSRASKFLQAAANTTVDGVVGQGTIASATAIDPKELVIKINAQRLEFLQKLPTWSTFGKGWGKRVSETEKTSLEMAEHA